MNIIELIHFFEEKVEKRKSKRIKTDRNLELIRQEILILKVPHPSVRYIYLKLKREQGCIFSYQYFMKLVNSNWNTLVDDEGKCCIIVSSERDKLCHW